VFGHEFGGRPGDNVMPGPPGVFRFAMQEPLPLLVESKVFPKWHEPQGYRYLWMSQICPDPMDMSCCMPSGERVLFLDPCWPPDAAASETSRVLVYQIDLPGLVEVDTTSFQIRQALWKRVRGCRTAPYALVEGSADTLVLYVPSQDRADHVIYVCKLTQQGLPIEPPSVADEYVNDFGQKQQIVRQNIILHGVSGDGRPKGILVYGYDRSGNIHYHIWDRSDKYWREQ
jgi:hypothetical protein